jgi:type IX secretion system PorP/SprF family membrane protein
LLAIAVAAAREQIDFRFVYRKQWAGLEGSPNTQTITGYARLKKFPLGIGGTVFHDATGPIRNIGFSVSAAYGIEFKNESVLSAGIGLGILRFSLGNDITIREVGDAAVAAAQQSKYLPDMSMGIYYRWKGFYAGFSMPQIVQSSLKLDVNDPLKMNKLIRHYFIAIGYKFSVSKKFELEPSLQLKAVKAAPLQADINLRAIYDNLAWLGVSYRSSDAVAVMAGVIIKDMFQIGYSYDITTSNLSSVSNGSHEVLLNYRLKRDKK